MDGDLPPEEHHVSPLSNDINEEQSIYGAEALVDPERDLISLSTTSSNASSNQDVLVPVAEANPYRYLSYCFETVASSTSQLMRTPALIGSSLYSSIPSFSRSYKENDEPPASQGRSFRRSIYSDSFVNDAFIRDLQTSSAISQSQPAVSSIQSAFHLVSLSLSFSQSVDNFDAINAAINPPNFTEPQDIESGRLPSYGFSVYKEEDLKLAIDKCRALIQLHYTSRDKLNMLVRKLILLRYFLYQVQQQKDTNGEVLNIRNHSLVSIRNFRVGSVCFSCAWPIIHFYHSACICKGCSAIYHYKCEPKIECPLVRADTPDWLITEFRPESTLVKQAFRCITCSERVAPQLVRFCNYEFDYHCSKCHWNQCAVIPVHVLQNWDFDSRPVCCACACLLRHTRKRALLRLDIIHPQLFNLVEELHTVNVYRKKLLQMKPYLMQCRVASSQSLLLRLDHRQHFIENDNVYSFQDLLDLNDNILVPELEKIVKDFTTHIKSECAICAAQAFICEFCQVDEVIFPFDTEAAVCNECSATFHRDCFDLPCPRCERKRSRSLARNALVIET